MSTAKASGEHTPAEMAPAGSDAALSAEVTDSPVVADSRLSFWKLASLFGLYYCIQGIGEPTDGLLAQPLRSMLESWGQSATEIGAFIGVLGLPWTVKPIYGLLSDFVPLAGYRRKSYLVLTSFVAAVGFLLLWWLPLSSEVVWPLWVLLPCAAVGIAFTDVVVDALMVEKGQPLGLTGQFQSIQWGCIWGETIVSGSLGGYLAEHELLGVGFLICGLAMLAAMVLTIIFVREKKQQVDRARLVSTLAQLRLAARSPAVLAVGAFLFLWNFNPFSSSVLQMHMTKVIGFNEQFYGYMTSVNAAGAMLGSLEYGLYCRHVSRRLLIHLSIVLGVLATLAYAVVDGKTSALLASFVSGAATGTAYMVQLDLAAQACPLLTAGTVFALLMSLSNLGISFSTILGGRWYDEWSAVWDKPTAFVLLVWVGAAFTAGCWLLFPFLVHSLPRGRVPEA